MRKKNLLKKKGFAISVDALLATVLTITVLTFVGFGMQTSEESITPSEIRIRQTVDDTFTALDNSGFLSYALVDATETNPAITILEKAQTLVSKNTGLGIEVTEYESTGTIPCNDFDQCFGPLKEVFIANIPIPSDREIMHGRKILISKSVGADISGNQCQIIETQFFEEKEKITAMFQEEEKTISTQAIVTDETMNPLLELSCDEGSQTEKAVVTLKIKDNSRDPIAVVMATDKSGSMGEYDLLQQTSGNAITFNEGFCNNKACVKAETNCVTYTDWDPNAIGEFYVDAELLSKLPYSNSQARIDQTATITDLCGYTPKFKVTAPDGTEFTQLSHYAYVTKDPLEAHNVEGEPWIVTGWSNISVTKRVYLHLLDGTYTYLLTGGTLGGGIKTGTGTECVVPEDMIEGNWQLLATKNITPEEKVTRIYGKMEYTGYEGDCAPRMKFISKSSGVEREVICPSSSGSNTCSTNFYHGVNAPYGEGDYEIWGWSDDTVTNVNASYYIDLFVQDIATSAIVEGGTCGGTTCQYLTDSCPDIFYQGYTNRQLTSQFSLSDEIRSSATVTTLSGAPITLGFCNNVPIARLIDPEGNPINETIDYKVDYDGSDLSPAQADGWKLETWSDTPVVSDFYAQAYNRLEDETAFSIEGEDLAQACNDETKWKLMKEFTLSENAMKIKSEVLYEGYAGSCGMPKIKIETPTVTEATPLSCTSDFFCHSYQVVGGFFYIASCNHHNLKCKIELSRTNSDARSTYLEPRQYKIYMWSDAEIESTYNLDKYDEIKILDDVAVQNGTCYDQSCEEPAEPNCDQTKTNWFDEEQGATGNLAIMAVSEEDHFMGLKASIEYGGYSGVCSGAEFRIRKPDGSIATTNWKTTAVHGKANTSKIVTGTPLETGNWEFEGWSDESIYINYIDWYARRIDAANKAAKTFIDNTAWDSGDKLGLVSFSSLAEVASPLESDNTEAVKTALDDLVPEGQTGLAGAIAQSTALLEQASLSDETAKFIILLTDGRANICLDGEACSEEEAGLDAIEAADLARENAAATIYVIGFVDPSIGDYADTLRQIAKDPEAGECVGGLCGKYYFAEDEEELEEIYSQVIGEIRESFGIVDLEIPIKEGIEPINLETTGKSGIWNDSDGTWDTETGNNPEVGLEWDEEKREIVLKGKPIHYTEEDLWFAVQFEVVVPCNGIYCDLNYVVFPNEGMEIIDEDRAVTKWTKETGEDKYCSAQNQPCTDSYIKMPFKYKNIGINFVSGTIVGNDIFLDLNIGNRGFKEIDLETTPLKIKFFNLDGSVIAGAECDGGTCTLKPSQKNIDGGTAQLDGIVSWPEEGTMSLEGISLCKVFPDTIGCDYSTTSDTETTIENIKIPTEDPGTIIAEIDSTSILECSKGNTARIYCGAEEFKFFTIDYYAWVK